MINNVICTLFSEADPVQSLSLFSQHSLGTPTTKKNQLVHVHKIFAIKLPCVFIVLTNKNSLLGLLRLDTA